MLTRKVAWVTDETARRRSEKQQGRFGRGPPEWIPQGMNAVECHVGHGGPGKDAEDGVDVEKPLPSAFGGGVASSAFAPQGVWIETPL